MAGERAVKLACQHGHWEMFEPVLRRLGEGSWAMVVKCDLGDHYLTPSATVPGIYEFSLTPYGFASGEDAFAAADTFATAFEQRYR